MATGGFCRTRIPNAIGQCTRRAMPGGEHCQQHAQAAYVRQWREAHPTGTWGEVWCCPLCGKAIQTTLEGAQYHRHDVEAHQQMHGDSWLAYLAAGGPSDAEG